MPATASTPKFHIPKKILRDLCVQFIYHDPRDEVFDLMRTCSDIEKAYWHYQRAYLPHDKSLRRGTLQQFASLIFSFLNLVPGVNVRKVVEDYEEYKDHIPTHGAIILTPWLDKVLLVQSRKGNWGFPKGKMEEFEEPEDCAAREVMEEVGLDIRNLIVKNRFLEEKERKHIARLYIIPGIKESTELSTSCPEEIKDIKWFKLSSLPTSFQDEKSKQKLGIQPRKFYNTIPFLRNIQLWVKELGTPKLVQFLENCPEMKDNDVISRSLYCQSNEKPQEKHASYGAVLLTNNLKKILLVKAANGGWGFPGGNIKEFENPEECAARKVREEAGLEISNMMDKDRFLDKTVGGQTARLYIIPGMGERTEFGTSCSEIVDIRWFSLDSFPSSLSKDTRRRIVSGIPAYKLLNALPFIEDIRDWVKVKVQRSEPAERMGDNPERVTKFWELARVLEKLELGDVGDTPLATNHIDEKVQEQFKEHKENGICKHFEANGNNDNESKEPVKVEPEVVKDVCPSNCKIIDKIIENNTSKEITDEAVIHTESDELGNEEKKESCNDDINEGVDCFALFLKLKKMFISSLGLMAKMFKNQ